MNKRAIIPILLAIFISTVCAQTVKNETSLVPVVKIDGTNLYTGIFYKMFIKTFSPGWVVRAEWRSETYVQIERTPEVLSKYEPGKEYQYENQWYIEAMGSSGCYTLVNRMKKDGVLTYKGHYAAIFDRESIKASGDSYLIRAQWRFKATEDEDYYKVENVQWPKYLMTWTYTKHNQHNYYIQISNQDFGDDSMFSFKLPSVTLKATVNNIQFNQLPDGPSKILVNKQNFPNGNKTDLFQILNETYPTTNSFSISFINPIAAVKQTTISINNLFDLSPAELIFDGGFQADQERSVDVSKNLTLNSLIRVPPYSETEVSIYTIRSDIEVTFTATLILTGTTERILKDQPGEVQEGPVPSDFIQKYLLDMGDSNFEIISSDGNELRISVQGSMKANITQKVDFESVNIKKEDPKTSAGFLKNLFRGVGK